MSMKGFKPEIVAPAVCGYFRKARVFRGVGGLWVKGW
jgi:hypothetical protein